MHFPTTDRRCGSHSAIETMRQYQNREQYASVVVNAVAILIDVAPRNHRLGDWLVPSAALRVSVFVGKLAWLFPRGLTCLHKRTRMVALSHNI